MLITHLRSSFKKKLEKNDQRSGTLVAILRLPKIFYFDDCFIALALSDPCTESPNLSSHLTTNDPTLGCLDLALDYLLAHFALSSSPLLVGSLAPPKIMLSTASLPSLSFHPCCPSPSPPSPLFCPYFSIASSPSLLHSPLSWSQAQALGPWHYCPNQKKKKKKRER